MAAETAFSTHFLSHAGYLAGKQVQRVYHLVQVLLQLQEFTLYVNSDFLRQVAFSYGCGYVGNVPHLHGEVRGHVVYVIRQVFPDTAHARHTGLAPELALGTHFLGHAGYLAGKYVQVINRFVDGFSHQFEVP